MCVCVRERERERERGGETSQFHWWFVVINVTVKTLKRNYKLKETADLTYQLTTLIDTILAP